MSVSPINIVVSFDPDAMLHFQKAGSLAAFKNYKKTHQRSPDPGGQQVLFSEGTHIFDNISPNSNFISLSHSFGLAKGMELQIELIDPNGVFEKTLLDNSVETWWPAKTDPVFEHFQKNADDIRVVRGELNTLLRTPVLPTISNPNRTRELPTVLDYSSKITLLTDKLETLLKYKDDIIKSRRTFDRKVTMQRPIYVTYGLGDNLQNWSPIQCYGKIIRFEYSFNGSGVRVIKLVLLGLGAHPSLTQEGLSVLGRSFTAGLLTQGTSDLVFNAKATEKFKGSLTKKKDVGPTVRDMEENVIFPGYNQTQAVEDLEKLLSNPLKPSLHIAITQALTDFIKKGINDENVYVLLPDLDKALKRNIDMALEKNKDRIKPINPSPTLEAGAVEPGDTQYTPPLSLSDIRYFMAFNSVLLSLGFSLCESSYSLSPVGKNVNRELESIYQAEEEIDLPGDPVPAWFQGRNFRVALQCNYEHTTFLDKLKQIAELFEKVITLSGGKSPLMMRAPQAETDLGALRQMKKAGLIPRTDKPLIYWGDSNLISSYLYGGAIETAEYDRPEARDTLENIMYPAPPISEGKPGDLNFAMGVRTKLWEVIHPLDRLNGLDINYMNSLLWESYVPDLTTPGDQPFGPTTTTDLFGTTEEMPLFTFGDKKPNILNIDFDINAIYTTAMFDAVPRPSTSSQRTSSLILRNSKTGIDFVNTVLDDMFKSDTGQDIMDDKDKDKVVRLSIKKLINAEIDPAMGYSTQWATAIGEGDIPDEFKTAVEDFMTERGSVYFANNPAVKAIRAFFAKRPSTLENLRGKKLATDAKSRELAKGVATKWSEEEPEFMRYMWKSFVDTHIVATNKRIYAPGTPIDDVIKNSARLQQSLLRSVMVGSITTVPFFHLSSMKRTFYKPCLVRCVEPSITLSNHDDKRDNFTWFSGLYEITGFKHTITSSMASSQFSLVKGINSSLMVQDKRRDIMADMMRGNDPFSKQ